MKLKLSSEYVETTLDGHHELGILIPTQQRVVAVCTLSRLDIGPSPHELFMGHDTGEAASDGTIDALHDREVCREEDVKVSLVNLGAALVLWKMCEDRNRGRTHQRR